MVYLMLVCVVMAVLLLFVRSEFRTRSMVSMFLVLFFFVLSLCFFLLYFCKSSFNLSIFQKYFQVPRTVAARLYFLKISKEAVICCMNLGCILFVASNLFFAATLTGWEKSRKFKRLYPAALLFFALEFLLSSPAVYIRAYSFFYPAYMTPEGVEQLWSGLDKLCEIGNFMILMLCLGMTLIYIVRIPHIKVYRISLLITFVSWFMLILCYQMLMGRLPMQLIRYSKTMDVVTYRLLFVDSRVPMYRALPYLIFVFIVLLAIWSYRLNMLRSKLENYSLEVSKNINAVNMSTRVFCHFMKNELLNLQAEVENLSVREEDAEEKELLVEHCEALYGRLDDIHKHIRDNTMNLRQLQLDSLIRETVEETKLSRPEQDIQWTVSIPAEPPYVFADEEYLKQALINLLNNACDAVDHGDGQERENNKRHASQAVSSDKKISVRVLSDSKWGIIEVGDNGCGIPEEDRINIFTPFFSSKPMTKSWGMGLSLTHRIITDFGGKIDVESEPGVGTVFYIYLPMSQV